MDWKLSAESWADPGVESYEIGVESYEIREQEVGRYAHNFDQTLQWFEAKAVWGRAVKNKEEEGWGREWKSWK